MLPAEYRVVAVCFECEESRDIGERLKMLETCLDEIILEQRPDLIVLPETVLTYGTSAPAGHGAERLDGPSVSMVSRLASRRVSNICIPIIEYDEGRLYNTAVYVDRKGGIAGLYRKQMPTPGEIKQGILPGHFEQPPVLLDGIRAGTAICFDHNFPDQAWRWIRHGVDLLIFPAYTYAGELMRWWAFSCGVPLVCAFPWESVIYDRDGSVLAVGGTETSTMRMGYHPRWIACTLDFRSRIYHLDHNQLRLAELMSRYGGRIDARLMVRDARMMLTFRDPGLDMGAVEREFGFVRLQDYLRDSRLLAEKASGREIM